MLVQVIFSSIVFIAVVLICMAVFYFWQKKENLKHQSQRLEQVVNIQTTGYTQADVLSDDAQAAEQTGIRRDTRISAIPWLDTLLSKRLKSQSKSLMILIEQSGLKIKVGEFLLFAGLIGVICTLLIHFFFHIPLVGLVFGILPVFLLHILKQKRVEAFVKQMPQALDLLSSDLRAGLDVQAGLKHLSEEFSAPLGDEFAKVVVEINLGLTLNEALNNLASRVNTMDVQILCTGIIINRELGGNLSELIRSIGETVRERFRLKGMVKALTAENQMSAMLLVGLPIGLYILLNILSPTIYNSFAFDPVGRMILIACVVSMTFGYLVINKITKLEV